MPRVQKIFCLVLTNRQTVHSMQWQICKSLPEALSTALWIILTLGSLSWTRGKLSHVHLKINATFMLTAIPRISTLNILSIYSIKWGIFNKSVSKADYRNSALTPLLSKPESFHTTLPANGNRFTGISKPKIYIVSTSRITTYSSFVKRCTNNYCLMENGLLHEIKQALRH